MPRLEDLRASRQRLVAAQDAERRRLERNIHDGAQQQLVALTVKIRLARQFGAKDPGRAIELLEQTEREVSQALEDLRDLARGIYPPLLADQGLTAALKAQGRRAPLPVEVDGDSISRYSQVCREGRSAGGAGRRAAHRFHAGKGYTVTGPLPVDA